MTRETKIGLLVGLAFIIVIGILLSDQLMRSTEPPAAPLATAGDTLRKGTTTPASRVKPAAPAYTSTDASPDNEVPTRDEITRRPPPVTFVEIGGRQQQQQQNGAAPAVGVNQTGGGATQDQARGPVAIGGGQTGNDATPRRIGVNPPTGRSIVEVAEGMGETLLGPDGQPLRASKPLNTAGPANAGGGHGGSQPPVLAAGAMKQYTVEAGDSLSRIALRQMGANTKANRDAIVKANQSLQADPDRVIIGQTYNIPSPVGTTPQAQGRTPTPPVPAVPDRTTTPAPIKAASAEFWYQVQPGDNLWKIAKEQLGDTGSVPAIKELNKQNVKNWDVLVTGTKIRLPARPLASAQ